MRGKLLVSEAWRSLGANLSTTVAATMTVLIGMFLLGLFIALGTWTLSWSNHAKKQLEVKVFFKVDSTVGQRNAVAKMLEQNQFVKPGSIVYISPQRALEVMKLVGATNWFVRGPFMLEGLFCGLVGSALAVIFLMLGKAIALPAIASHLSGDSDVKALSFSLTALILVLMGLSLGAVGSGWTIRRFLRI